MKPLLHLSLLMALACAIALACTFGVRRTNTAIRELPHRLKYNPSESRTINGHWASIVEDTQTGQEYLVIDGVGIVALARGQQP